MGNQAVKRGIDIVGSTFALLLFSPILFVFGLLVKATSKGPVFFRQSRLGRNGVAFRIFKLRSMVNNAPDLRNPDGSAVTSATDARVTPVGAFIRKTSIDELPQFINVFLGHMSLVGPRPDQEDQIRFYTDDEKKKLLVKPGITGLAQISGRNTISWEQRKKLDVEYAENHSILGDLAIIAKTIPYVLLRRGINTEATPSSAVVSTNNAPVGSVRDN
jgi:undecaprenyl phosphate N,N'-diacetylbacillosamine 1-phosphate transferase